jgi:hypothetical protein
MDDFWKTVLWQQFGAAIDMLENAVRACPDELWSNTKEKAGMGQEERCRLLVRRIPHALLARFFFIGLGTGIRTAGAFHTRRVGSVGIASRAALYKGSASTLSRPRQRKVSRGYRSFDGRKSPRTTQTLIRRSQWCGTPSLQHASRPAPCSPA